jgi:hypothetical protein
MEFFDKTQGKLSNAAAHCVSVPIQKKHSPKGECFSKKYLSNQY